MQGRSRIAAIGASTSLTRSVMAMDSTTSNGAVGVGCSSPCAIIPRVRRCEPAPRRSKVSFNVSHRVDVKTVEAKWHGG
jgi:hypothetical protein